ncbi:LCP family protein [Kitasatospora cinereorecta]|uniref:LCP family protein n=1 Tax=Kitasatospora cinereorecta TaxID=285560 RepID=A0ABW0VLE6_9ACTN
MNSGHRNRNNLADSFPQDIDPADQWVLDPETGEFRLDLTAATVPAARTPMSPRTPRTAPGATPERSGPGDGGRSLGDGGHGGRAARRRGGKAGKPRRRRALKWTAGVAALVLVAGCGGAYYAYQHFNKNISSVEVQVGNDADRPKAAEGAMNILVIGTDSRVGLGREYGDEGSPGHADTTLLFHVSKDRSNATVMSIPRDLMVPIPECQTGTKKIAGTARAMFNESLGQEGRDPGCTWTTVEKMTGIHIDHFMMVNFEAVKTLSTAVGGVEVCAAKDINDPDSHLKMSKGKHVVQGDEALAFVRTRHAVGYGGDLTRIPLQQQFISSMIRKIKSSDTLTSPTKLWNLADAATKALTVDSKINDVNKLKDLALDLSSVNTKNITFTTVPVLDSTEKGESGRLVLKEPDAKQLFGMIAGDKSLTDVPGQADASAAAAPSAAPTTEAPAAPQVDAKSVRVTVRNGTGTTGQAAKAVTALQGKGFTQAGPGSNAEPSAASVISYPAGKADQAAALAAALGLPDTAAQQSSKLGAKDALVVTLGKDYGAGGGAPAAAVPTEAPKDLQRVQADDENLCAK